MKRFCAALMARFSYTGRMSREFDARRLDVKSFAEDGAAITGEQPVQEYERLMAETQGRGGELPVTWSATGELRNPGHVHRRP